MSPADAPRSVRHGRPASRSGRALRYTSSLSRGTEFVLLQRTESIAECLKASIMHALRRIKTGARENQK
ncbi:hypothetical protein GUJ93_ZPchr0006g43740 [Zizania palustris]|uniref:Uncharacterized protein n=1 Tax=Zizania palustris TaxID=103762 RepID=A0A8J5VGI2_ZIZPA|nr:hypothetical protein GUJ93_ZPchr0006g43740 [Zizania palustris]